MDGARGRTWLVAVLLGALGSTGCNSAYRAAMARAEEAVARGDDVGAALAFRDACSAAPDDERACAEERRLATALVQRSLAEGKRRCGAHDVPGCLAALSPGRAVRPGDPGLVALVEEAGRQHADRCAAGGVEGPVRAVALMRCLDSLRREADSPGYRERLGAEGARASAVFAALARRQDLHREPGAALALWDVAACFAPAPDVTAALQEAEGALLARSALPLQLRVSLAGSPSLPAPLLALCDSTQRQLGGSARCGPARGDGPAPLGLELSVELSPRRYQLAEEVRSVRWLAGTRQVKNAAYPAAEVRLVVAERALREIEKEAQLRRSSCSSSESELSRAGSCTACPERSRKERLCGEARAVGEIHDRRRDELAGARSRLSSTPAYLTEEVWETFRYVERHHHFSAAYRAELAIFGAVARHTFAGAGELGYTDDEHVGFAEAGLAADPRQDPPDDHFLQETARRLAAELARIADEEGKARAAARHARCSGPVEWTAPWLSCWAEARLWAGGELRGRELLAHGGRPLACF